MSVLLCFVLTDLPITVEKCVKVLPEETKRLAAERQASLLHSYRSSTWWRLKHLQDPSCPLHSDQASDLRQTRSATFIADSRQPIYIKY